MDNKAENIFENNPEIMVIYKVKGEPVYFTSKEGADAHGEAEKKKIETINRPGNEAAAKAAQEAEQKSKDDAAAKAAQEAEQKAKDEAAAKAAHDAAVKELPEGDPTKSWTIPQIQVWLKERDVKFTVNAKEANLLGKAAEYLANQKAK